VFVCVGIEKDIMGQVYGTTEETNYMCGTTGAAELAQNAGVKKLILVHNTHIGDHGVMERAIADVARVYDGEIVMGEELMEVPIHSKD